jgi:phage/plasmid-like protein (TIGR03299 family)
VAHEIFIDDGRAAMFYVGEKPWHKLGTQLKQPPSSEAAIAAAGLNWTVVKVPLYIAAQTRLHELKDRFALVREDTMGRPDCAVFGIVGLDYEPLQNSQAFDFFDPIIAQGYASYETAGALGHGERVWIQARLKRDIEIAAGDAIRRFLLLSNTHDATSSLQVKLTPVRVVCNNTLTAALAKGASIRIRHDQDMQARLEQAKELLGLVERGYRVLEVLFRRMASSKLNQQQAAAYFAQVFPDPASANPKARKQAATRRQWAMHFFHEGQGNREPPVRDTLWAAYNGVTELIDHGKPNALTPDFTSRRLHSIWFGAGAAMKQRALRVAEECATAVSPS